MRSALVFLVCLTVPFANLVAEESQGGRKVYKSIGEQGEVEFSDVPRSGSQTVTVPPPNVMTPPAVPKAAPSADEKATDIFKYQSIAVTSPPQEHTFTDGSGDAAISVQVTPPVESRLGHRLEVVMDGQAQAINGTGVTLTNLDRGEHTVQARVVDRDGNELIRTNSVTFFVQRPTVFGPASPIGPGPGPSPGPGPGGP